MIVRWFVALVLLGCAAAGAESEWPQFRGPSADGRAGADAKPPVTWSETENVRWKLETPNLGWSTPAIAGGQVWITAATEAGNDFYVLGVDAETGKVLHNLHAFHCDNPEPLGNNMNCYASPSPIIEAGRVYVHFGTYGTACIDTATGEKLWERTDLPCRHYRGPASSPIIWEDLLILTFDGVDQQYVCALNKDTGESVWRTDRSADYNDLDENGEPFREGDKRKAFSTPRVITLDATPVLLSCGSMVMYGYAPRTGEELWKFPHAGFSTSASPLFDGNLIYTTTGYGQSEAWAVRPDGTGEWSGDQVVWTYQSRDVPQASSMVLVDGLIYMVGNASTVTCLDAHTGEEVWTERLGGNYMASPLYAGGMLYFCSMQGKTTVLRPGRAFDQVAVNEFEDGFMASPVAVGDSLYLRTKTHLYRIAAP